MRKIVQFAHQTRQNENWPTLSTRNLVIICDHIEDGASPKAAVSPAYTSQQCSECGFTHEDNRPTSDGQNVFECLKCGYSPHADYNAAKNIGLKYLRSAQTSSGEGAPVDVRLNRGTLNVNGDYVPAADGGQNGSPHESPTGNEANGDAVSE